MPSPSEQNCDDIELPAWHAHRCFRSTREAIETAVLTMPPLRFHAWLNKQRSAWSDISRLLSSEFEELTVVEQDQRRALEANGVSKAALGLLDGWFDAAQRAVRGRMKLSSAVPANAKADDSKAAFERHRDNRGYVAQSVLVELIRNLPVGEASRVRADLLVARAFEFSDELLRQNTYETATQAEAELL